MNNWLGAIVKIVVFCGIMFGECKLIKWLVGLVPAGDWSALIKIMVGVGAIFLSCAIVVIAGALIWILLDRNDMGF